MVGMILKARKKAIPDFQCYQNEWGWMLDSGVGLPIGYAPAMEPSTFFFQMQKLGKDPINGDGYMISASQAKAMSLAAMGLTTSQRYINGQWDRMEPEERTRAEEFDRNNRIYRRYMRPDFPDMAERFAQWSWKSGGFRIY